MGGSKIIALLCVVWLALLAGALRITTAETSRYAAREAELLEPPPLAALSTRWLDVVMLGHRGLFDDLATIWLIQIFGDHRVADADPEALQRVVKSVTRHKPKVEPLYMISCITLGLFRKRPDLCEPIMLDGLDALPKSFLIPATQGFMSAFRMGDFAKAAQFYRIAATRPGAPEFISSLAAKLERGEGVVPEEAQGAFDDILKNPANEGLNRFLREKSPKE